MTGSLPRRYARALMELAGDKEGIEKFERALEGFAALLQRDPTILETLSNDSFEASERLAALEEIATQARFDPLIKNFLLLLIRKDRFALIPEIFREYRRLSDEVLGIVRVTVTAPQPPESQVLNEVQTILEKKLNKKVIPEGKARPEIMGGIILKIEHIVYDGSVRKELERMQETMLRG